LLSVFWKIFFQAVSRRLTLSVTLSKTGRNSSRRTDETQSFTPKRRQFPLAHRMGEGRGEGSFSFRAETVGSPSPIGWERARVRARLASVHCEAQRAASITESARSIPTGLRPPAQGCDLSSVGPAKEEGALGIQSGRRLNPNGVAALLRVVPIRYPVSGMGPWS